MAEQRAMRRDASTSGGGGARFPAGGQRIDIQVLRGVAVLAVMVFHLWPGRLPGGYVGVDVFFVISGFLITGQIVRELETTGRIRLATFWARRARRLLPAALLVAAAALVGTLLFVPEPNWSPFFREIAAATLYVENWVLAIDAVDYLAAENAASPMQHYWSLSVEEQFYLIWPLLALAAVALPLGGKIGRRGRIGIVLGLVVAVSLTISILLTPVDPGVAYFGTHVRAWQFGLGGLLAVAAPWLAGRLPRSGRIAIAWVGAVMVGAACLLFTADTEFPGSAALLPTVGAALLILGETGDRDWSPARIGRYVALDRLGDISYSAYLWHWPVIIIAGQYDENGLSLWQRVAILIATIVLAWATTRFVEGPLRRIRMDRPRRVGLILLGSLLAMALVAAPAIALWYEHRDKAALEFEMAHEAVLNDECLGAGARNPAVDCSGRESHSALIPDPAYAPDDRSRTYDDGCNVGPTSPELVACDYGLVGSDTRVALIGDSHSNMWFPALERIATDQGWQLTTFLHSSCPEASTPTTDACDAWRDKMQTVIDDYGAFDLVFVGNSRIANQYPTLDAAVESYRDVWQKYIDAGGLIVVMEDTPRTDNEVVDCLAVATTAADCRYPHDTIPDYMVEVARTMPEDAVVIETRDVMCEGDLCDSAIGGVVVYRDSNHITETFALSMAPIILDRLEEALHALP